MAFRMSLEDLAASVLEEPQHEGAPVDSENAAFSAMQIESPEPELQNLRPYVHGPIKLDHPPSEGGDIVRQHAREPNDAPMAARTQHSNGLGRGHGRDAFEPWQPGAAFQQNYGAGDSADATAAEDLSATGSERYDTSVPAAPPRGASAGTPSTPTGLQWRAHLASVAARRSRLHERIDVDSAASRHRPWLAPEQTTPPSSRRRQRAVESPRAKASMDRETQARFGITRMAAATPRNSRGFSRSHSASAITPRDANQSQPSGLMVAQSAMAAQARRESIEWTRKLRCVLDSFVSLSLLAVGVASTNSDREPLTNATMRAQRDIEALDLPEIATTAIVATLRGYLEAVFERLQKHNDQTGRVDAGVHASARPPDDPDAAEQSATKHQSVIAHLQRTFAQEQANLHQEVQHARDECVWLYTLLDSVAKEREGIAEQNSILSRDNLRLRAECQALASCEMKSRQSCSDSRIAGVNLRNTASDALGKSQRQVQHISGVSYAPTSRRRVVSHCGTVNLPPAGRNDCDVQTYEQFASTRSEYDDLAAVTLELQAERDAFEARVAALEAQLEAEQLHHNEALLFAVEQEKAITAAVAQTREQELQAALDTIVEMQSACLQPQTSRIGDQPRDAVSDVRAGAFSASLLPIQVAALRTQYDVPMADRTASLPSSARGPHADEPGPRDPGQRLQEVPLVRTGALEHSLRANELSPVDVSNVMSDVRTALTAMCMSLTNLGELLSSVRDGTDKHGDFLESKYQRSLTETLRHAGSIDRDLAIDTLHATISSLLGHRVLQLLRAQLAWPDADFQVARVEERYAAALANCQAMLGSAERECIDLRRKIDDTSSQFVALRHGYDATLQELRQAQAEILRLRTSREQERAQWTREQNALTSALEDMERRFSAMKKQVQGPPAGTQARRLPEPWDAGNILRDSGYQSQISRPHSSDGQQRHDIAFAMPISASAGAALLTAARARSSIPPFTAGNSSAF